MGVLYMSLMMYLRDIYDVYGKLVIYIGDFCDHLIWITVNPVGIYPVITYVGYFVDRYVSVMIITDGCSYTWNCG